MKYRITIPEPCQENWDKMTPAEKGRFYEVQEKPNRKAIILSYVFTALVVLASKNTTANPFKILNNAKTDISIRPEESKKSITIADTLTIRGRLVDTVGQSFGFGAEIVIKELPYETFADRNGHFTIRVREKISLDSITLVINPWGSYPKEVRISTKSLYKRELVTVVTDLTTFYSHPPNCGTFETVLVLDKEELPVQTYPTEEPARASIWKRIGNWFRWVF